MKGDESITTSGTKKKKKSIFKSITKGITRKKKKKHPDDASVLGVSIAEDSVVTGPPSTPVPSHVNGVASKSTAPASGPPILIILLLMDPNSRRFELLQLEFDSSKALVSDVLLQIDQSATEKALREMSYGGVCDLGGMEMISSVKLSQFCKAGEGSQVILALPKGLSGKETVALATPILEDEKVIEMLRPCGVKLEPKPKKSNSSKQGGNSLSKIDEEKPTTAVNTRSIPTDLTKSKPAPSSFPTAVLGIIISAILAFAIKKHLNVTQPIQSGQCLHSGEWRSSCGIWELFPGNKLCDSSSLSKLSMDEDGKLKYFKAANGANMVEEWSVGAECAVNDAECVVNLDCNGAIFTEEGGRWYVEVNGDRKLLKEDVVQTFTE